MAKSGLLIAHGSFYLSARLNLLFTLIHGVEHEPSFIYSSDGSHFVILYKAVSSKLEDFKRIIAADQAAFSASPCFLTCLRW